MQTDVLAWRHVTLNVKYRWLPGDPRGFRSRKHRIHSSGDYKNPPPPGEHEGLYKQNQYLEENLRRIPLRLREKIGMAILSKLTGLGYESLVISVSSDHVHILAKLPFDPAKTKKAIGQCKGFASHEVTDELPGQLWAEGGDYRLIKDWAHQERAFYYIRDDQGADTWRWTFDGSHLPRENG